MMPKSGATFMAERDGMWIVFKIFVYGYHAEMHVKSHYLVEKPTEKNRRLNISSRKSILSPFFFDQFVRREILHILMYCQSESTVFLVSINLFPTIWVMLVLESETHVGIPPVLQTRTVKFRTGGLFLTFRWHFSDFRPGSGCLSTTVTVRKR